MPLILTEHFSVCQRRLIQSETFLSDLSVAKRKEKGMRVIYRYLSSKLRVQRQWERKSNWTSSYDSSLFIINKQHRFLRCNVETIRLHQSKGEKLFV